MKDSISKRDWETISAYLDGQLSPRKQARLESRLQTDHRLQVALEELSATRKILRQTPRLSAPRNFILTPEMAGRPIRMPRLAPFFGWASALASFLLVLVLVGDIFNAGGFLPLATDDLQQDFSFLFPQPKITEEEISVQPFNIEVAEAPLKGVTEETTSPEPSKDQALSELAAEPIGEPPPTHDSNSDVAASKTVVAADEETPFETPSERAGTTVIGEPLIETPKEEALDEDAVMKSGRQPEEVESVETTSNLVEGSSITDTLDTVNIQEQPAESPQEEQASTLLPEEKPEQPSDAADWTPSTMPQVFQAEQPTLEDPQASTSDDTWFVVETPVDDIPFAERNRDSFLGLEVLLALFAFGTGLAWLIMSRRGG
jgi:hypothetical protein